jgi:ABC-type transporter Mla MlaB component
MSLSVSYAPQQAVLNLRFDGNLDVSAAMPVCDLCKRVPKDMERCVLDLSRVERVFDSGFALLQMLYRRLARRPTEILVVGNSVLARRLAESLGSTGG